MPDKSIFIKQMIVVSCRAPDHYNNTYPSFLKFFESRGSKVTADDFVIAANFIYGWMPKILKLGADKSDWLKAAEILKKARNQQIRESNDLELLKTLLGNSLVAASKILHFANPNLHPIWDRRVCRYLRNCKSGNGVDSIVYLLEYFDVCEKISRWPEMKELLPSFQKNYGSMTTLFRAIELTMFINGKK